MSRSTWFATAGLLALLAGCADQPPPTAPQSGRIARSSGLTGQQERLERLARRFALAMHNPEFRHKVRERIEASGFREHKVFFQGFLADSNREGLVQMARESGAPEQEIESDAANAMGLELYLPVPEHRRRWSGDEGFLVATAIADGDTPIAFDSRGHRHVLDPLHPPATPVLAIEPVETDFSIPPQGSPAGATCADCIPPPPGGGGGGGGPSPAPGGPGIYMTYAHVEPQFEGWLKGSPEYEVHILGQLNQSDSLATYQCAGEHASGPYNYDQDNPDWTGNVLLYTQAQEAAYKLAHPGQSWRIFLVEDDDTSCVIKNGEGTVETILSLVDSRYALRTGARDTTFINGLKAVKNARSYQHVLTQIAHIFLTNDEMVGDAIEDLVASEYHAGANWIVKGENNATTGWLKIEQK